MDNTELNKKSSNKKLYFLGGLGAFIVALLCLPKKNNVSITNINVGTLNINKNNGSK